MTIFYILHVSCNLGGQLRCFSLKQYKIRTLPSRNWQRDEFSIGYSVRHAFLRNSRPIKKPTESRRFLLFFLWISVNIRAKCNSYLWIMVGFVNSVCTKGPIFTLLQLSELLEAKARNVDLNRTI